MFRFKQDNFLKKSILLMLKSKTFIIVCILKVFVIFILRVGIP